MTCSVASLTSLGPPVRMRAWQEYLPACAWSALSRESVLFHRSEKWKATPASSMGTPSFSQTSSSSCSGRALAMHCGEERRGEEREKERLEFKKEEKKTQQRFGCNNDIRCTGI